MIIPFEYDRPSSQDRPDERATSRKTLGKVIELLEAASIPFESFHDDFWDADYIWIPHVEEEKPAASIECHAGSYGFPYTVEAAQVFPNGDVKKVNGYLSPEEAVKLIHEWIEKGEIEI